jgi:uncharacterized caspase-like protein
MEWDVFVMYAAGHGAAAVCQGERALYHFLTHRSSLKDPQTICETGISEQHIVDFLNSVRVLNKLLIIDSCQSGKMARGALRSTADGFRQIHKDGTVAILAASKRAQAAIEIPELGHGVFTEALIRGLRGGAEMEGRITPRSLSDFVASKTRQLSAEYGVEHQVPVTDFMGEGFTIALPDRGSAD